MARTRFYTVCAMAAVGLTSWVAPAQAQNPYVPGSVAVPLCSINIYSSDLRVFCLDDFFPLLKSPHRYVIGETILGEVGREAGFVVVVNDAPEPVEVLVRIRIDGDFMFRMPDGSLRAQSHVMSFVVPGDGSYSWDLRGDPLFRDTENVKRWTIRTTVYASRPVTAHTATWPRESVGKSGDIVRIGQRVQWP